MHKQEASILFKALGNESRVKIIKVLYHRGELCACKCLDLVDCKQATLSHHLSVLLKCGLLTQRKEGTNVIYACNKPLVDELLHFIPTKCGCVSKD